MNYGGLVAALGAAACYGAAPVAQAVAARDEPRARGLGLGLLGRLVRRPVWLAGFGCEIGAFVLEAYAFSSAPATLVAPIASCDMLVFLLLAAVTLAVRWTRRTVLGGVATAGGVVLLGVSLGGDDKLGRPAPDWVLPVLLGGCVVVTAVAVVGARGRRGVAQAAAFGVAAGVTYGVATLATRQVGRTFTTDRPLDLLATPTLYVLAACTALALIALQRGLQDGAVIAYPITSALSAFLPVAIGAALLDDPVPGGASRVEFVVALVAIALGLVLLAGYRTVAEDVDAGDAAATRPRRR